MPSSILESGMTDEEWGKPCMAMSGSDAQLHEQTTKTRRKSVWTFAGENWKIAIGGLITTVVLLGALVGPIVWDVDPFLQRLELRLTAPTFKFTEAPLGTDHLGRDVLARLLWGARVSLSVGGMSLAVAGGLGSFLGLISGYYRGYLDFGITKIVEFFMSLPSMLVAISVMAVIGQGMWNLVLLLGFTRWIGFTRQVRGEVLTLREMEYVAAARTLGASDSWILRRHIFANTVPSLMVVTTFTLATLIIAESSLSFLGVGVPPTVPTWGVMLSESRTFITRAWWMSVFPGAAIFLTVLGVNLLGDGLRDYLDPRLQR